MKDAQGWECSQNRNGHGREHVTSGAVVRQVTNNRAHERKKDTSHINFKHPSTGTAAEHTATSTLIFVALKMRHCAKEEDSQEGTYIYIYKHRKSRSVCKKANSFS